MMAGKEGLGISLIPRPMLFSCQTTSFLVCFLFTGIFNSHHPVAADQLPTSPNAWFLSLLLKSRMGLILSSAHLTGGVRLLIHACFLSHSYWLVLSFLIQPSTSLLSRKRMRTSSRFLLTSIFFFQMIEVKSLMLRLNLTFQDFHQIAWRFLPKYRTLYKSQVTWPLDLGGDLKINLKTRFLKHKCGPV